MITTIDTRTPLMPQTTQQVVVVSNQSQVNGLLETVLDAGQYDIVLLESTEHAYSHIKNLMPHLVIVCLDVDDLDGFRVLSMLKLDADTRHLPVVTCTISREEDPLAGESFEHADDVFTQPVAMQVH